MPEESEVVLWEPKPFDGNDLLPMQAIQNKVAEVEGVPALVGRDNVDPDDLILPSMSLLQGQSDAVQNRVEGAAPGLFMHTGTEEVLPEGDLRLILVHHHKGNALFPKAENPDYAGLETCISPDGVEGTVYGACEECRKCLDWRGPGEKLPPLGAETHHFVAFTQWGPAMIRMARSSYKAACKFVSTWSMSSKNLWAHPVVVRIQQGSKELQSGKTTKFYHMQLAWQVTERVPDEMQRAAYRLYQDVAAKHESGNLKTQDETAPDPEFG